MERFDEIEVKRINVVDEDGTLRLSISNKDQMPDPIVDGKAVTRSGPKTAGWIYYNDEGDECGGFIFGGAKTEDGHHTVGHLSFDQYKQDQVLVLSNNESGGKRYTGLAISDRSTETSLAKIVEDIEAAREMDEGEEKQKRMAELDEKYRPAQRVMLGRGRDGEAALVLSDSKGIPRIVAMVDQNDNPTLQFLNEKGEVTYSLP